MTCPTCTEEQLDLQISEGFARSWDTWPSRWSTHIDSDTYHIGVWSRSDSSLPTDSHGIAVVGEGNAVVRTAAVAACQWSRELNHTTQARSLPSIRSSLSKRPLICKFANYSKDDLTELPFMHKRCLFSTNTWPLHFWPFCVVILIYLFPRYCMWLPYKDCMWLPYKDCTWLPYMSRSLAALKCWDVREPHNDLCNRL